jgi:hypothetical protein
MLADSNQRADLHSVGFCQSSPQTSPGLQGSKATPRPPASVAPEEETREPRAFNPLVEEVTAALDAPAKVGRGKLLVEGHRARERERHASLAVPGASHRCVGV